MWHWMLQPLRHTRLVPTLRSRSGVLRWVLTLQALVLLVGAVGSYLLIQGRLAHVAQQQLIDQDAQVAAYVAALVRKLITQTVIPITVLSGMIVLAITGVLAFVLVGRYMREFARVSKVLKHTNQSLALLGRNLQEDTARRLKQSLAMRHALIFGLAKLADYRDTDTGAHLERICTYSVMLAEELRDQFREINDEWIECLRLAASLHDIGKVGIPDRILLKPGRLTDEERQVMQTHPMLGADTLIAIREKIGEDNLVHMGIQIAIGHHERWDGKGYPYGLEGEQISLAARIVALADVYDALTSKRVYKAAMGHEKTTGIIVEGRGTQFDPVVVDAFMRINERFNEVRREHQEGDAEVPHLYTVCEPDDAQAA
jgi:HD-GYP domain-containing protein (c-di-GMP phosphodiesterase class II)